MEKSNRFTQEQTLAIESNGKTIVSASAGSGKTTVMIEKIIRLILDGTDVSQVLAVTFTKKAAAQMKEKLRKAIIKAINDPTLPKPRRTALKKQLDGVSSADISTIHSFCAKLIRTNFYLAGVDNGFRVIGSDDAEGTALQNEALDEVLEEGYETQDKAFMSLLSTYWRKKSDNRLRQILLSAYAELRNRADYREYLQTQTYDESTFQGVCNDLHALLKEKCAYYLTLLQAEQAYFEQEGGAPQLSLCAELTLALKNVLQTKDYFSACALVKPPFTSKRTSKKDSDEKKRRIERLASLKAKIVKIYDDELYPTKSREEELSAFLCAGETATALAKYLLLFDDKYSELKTSRGVLDYNDLEHKALALMKQEEIAKETREKYVYVFVDEYQDVNPVQEELLSLVGKDNVFLVGDVKQSIYGFRGSKSKFFVQKQKSFEYGEGTSLFMTSNFRSADAVLDAVNAQFALAMTSQTSSVDYERDSWMNRGGRYALNDGKTQIHFIDEEEKEKKISRGVYSVRANARKKQHEENNVAKRIRHIIEEERKGKWYDADTGEYRPVRYADIAILSRKKQGQIGKTVASLSAEGIPVTSVAAVNICDYAEIKTLIDILSLLDNAEQDVPLCSALLSSMGNLTLDELTDIRLAYKDEKKFRTACKRYAEEYKDKTAYKLQKFYAYYQELRRLSCVLDAGELLSKLIMETRMEAKLLSRENGALSVKRIHRFVEETYNGEPLCIRAFLERLRDLNFRIEYNENGGEDSVKVLTMHSSKGLEYPVVILDDLSAPFRGVDTDEVLLEEKYGLAPRAFNGENMTKKTTLLRRLCDKKSQESSIADELNLYYVALTRAKYSLHLLFKKSCVLPDVRYARSFAEFTDFSVWQKYIVQDELFDIPKQERTAFAFHPDENLARDIMEAFLWEYPHSGYENLPVKSSATQLLQDAPVLVQPVERYEGETNTDKGIAYHAFLEKFDFSRLYQNESVEKAIEDTLLLLPEPQRELLSKSQLEQILRNTIFSKLQDKTLYKEQQFLVCLPIKDTYAKKINVSQRLREQSSEEEMIFQGAIDLLAVGEEEVRIIDYKYSTKDAEYLKTHYKPQLDLYKQAVSKILHKEMSKISCTIVNIYLGFEVEVE